MSQKVDPFIHPIPESLKKNSETRSYFEYLNRWAHDMWVRSGGGSDEVANNATREVYPWLQEYNPDLIETPPASVYPIVQLEGEYVKLLRTKELNGETYTAQNNMAIYAKNNSTLIMPENPIRNSQINFTKDDTQFTLRPNGKRVNGTLEPITFLRSGLARQIFYFADSGEWRFI